MVAVVGAGGRWWRVVVYNNTDKCYRYCLKVFFFIWLKYNNRSQGAPKRGNPTITTSTVTARRKGEGNMNNENYQNKRNMMTSARDPKQVSD